MKRFRYTRLLSLVLTAIMASGFVIACNGADDPAETTTAATTAATTTAATTGETDDGTDDPEETEDTGSETTDTTDETDESETTGSDPVVTESEETTAGPVTGDPFTVTAMLTTQGGIPTDTPVQKAWHALMEEKLGRPLVFEADYVPAAEYDERANLIINGNMMPDFMITPFLYDYNDLGEQGLIIDLAAHKDRMPNYFGVVDLSHDGLMRISNDAGQVYGLWEVELPRLPADQGLVAQNMTTYRTDIFEEHDIEVPETQEEFLEAARALKALYPDEYPVNTQFQSLNALFFANHVTNDIFWNGEDYVYGPHTEGYSDAIRFAATLYQEGLMDPEYLTETNDTIREKALNDRNMMWLTMWFTTPGEFTRLSDWEKVYTVALTPANEKYGHPYENRSYTSDVGLSNWSVGVLSAQAEDPETLVDFIDLQFSDEVIRLITWGIEGDSYILDDEGNPTFVDEIKNAEDPWLAGDKWGIRMSRNYRPGLSIAADTAAYVDSAPDDSVYVDGTIERVPVEFAFIDIPYPDSPHTPPWFNAPTLQFTTEESEELGNIMTAVNSMRDELQAYIISGDEPLELLDNFADELAVMGDVERALEIYRTAKARYDAR